MGNQTSNQINQRNQKHLQELINLVNSNIDTPYHLSFDPFNYHSLSIDVAADQRVSRSLSDLSIPQRLSEFNSLEHNMETQEASNIQNGFVRTALVDQNHLQKNQVSQISQKKSTKRKQIKKTLKTKETIAQMPLEQQQELQICEEAEMTTAPDEEIRDQNNCKSYHKLVKNYLQSKNYGYLLEKYEKKYHTRYYFVVALILIKYYVNRNFSQQYAKIVEKEVKAQQKKKNNKINEKIKLQLKIKQMKVFSRDTRDIQMKRSKIQKQINHIQVVIYEIKEFSMRSCTAFFQGDIEESLKILYMKDDTVMRKRYYFDPALEIVREIQAQVRKTSSRHS